MKRIYTNESNAVRLSQMNLKKKKKVIVVDIIGPKK